MAGQAVEAYRRFIEAAQQLGGLTEAQAAAVFEVYRKAKAIKLDLNSHRWIVTHGALWDREVLRDAAGLPQQNPRRAVAAKPRTVKLIAPLRANPFPPSVRRSLLARMDADGCDTFKAKVAWVKRHLPGIDDPQAFVGALVAQSAERRRAK